MKKLLSASVMCADLLNMGKSVSDLKEAGIDWLHIDIMDGCFVPNITLGFDLVNSIKKATDMPLDVHMMVSEPQRFFDRMKLSENDIICIHYEACENFSEALSLIKEKGCKVGLAINPLTPVETIKDFADKADMILVMTVTPGFAGQKMFEGAEEKVKKCREILDSMGLSHIPIQVDGNISFENGAKLSKAGADIFVQGTSSLFMKDKTIKEAAEEFRKVL